MVVADLPAAPWERTPTSGRGPRRVGLSSKGVRARARCGAWSDSLNSRAPIGDVRLACQRAWQSDAVDVAIGRLAELALRFLSEEADLVALRSSVAGKSYVSFSRDGVVARPANRDLFELDAGDVGERWRSWREDRAAAKFSRLAYTVALAPCLAFELLNRNNKKGPATYFECLVGHIFACSLGLEPRRRTALSVLDRTPRMTMDFLFETAEGAANIHLPIKMSTRVNASCRLGRINEYSTRRSAPGPTVA